MAMAVENNEIMLMAGENLRMAKAKVSVKETKKIMAKVINNEEINMAAKIGESLA
jgi:hypothetical protein